MKHPTAEQLAAFHDGTADARTLVAVEEHLNACAECHEVLASLERQDRALTAALTLDPGDAHFEALASRIEARLGEEPQFATEPGAAPGRPGLLAAGASAALAWLASFADGLRLGRAPQWAGAVAALLVGLGLVIINMKQATTPAMRSRALEQRAGQAADDSRERGAVEGERRGEATAPGENAKLGSEGARDDAYRAMPPTAKNKDKVAALSAPSPAASAVPSTVPAPAQKQESQSSRAQMMKRSPSGEEQPVGKAQGFAQPPPSAGSASAKPRRALPLDESQPKTEPVPVPGAKEADQARNQAAAKSAAKPGAPSPTAELPPEPEATRPAAPAPTGAAPAPREPQPTVPTVPGVMSQRESAAATSRSLMYSQDAKRDAQGTIRLCGMVRDSRGRPIPSASVTLVSQGSGVPTDPQGRFCIASPPGEQTLSVMAVGFAPLRMAVNVAADSPPPVFTLIAVSVLDASSVLRGDVHNLGGHAQTGAPGNLAQAFPDSLQPVAGRAIRLTLEAQRTKSAQHFEAAAAEWEKVRAQAPDGQIELEARFRTAEARFRAWELAPTPKRVAAANEALTSFLVRAQLGARRDTASVWLGRVKP